MSLTEVWALAKYSVSDWIDDKAFELGAAIAYYTIFSLAPILLISIIVAGAVLGEEAAQGQIAQKIEGIVGEQGAEAVESMIDSTRRSGGSGWAATLGVVLILVGATGVFSQLKSALNTVWEVPPGRQASGIWGILKSRLLALVLVLVVGAMLLALIAGSAAISAVVKYLPDVGGLSRWLLPLGDVAVSIVVLTALFAVIYKVLPDCEIAWRDVWVGALTTAVLFTIGKIGIGMYLGRGAVASTYGAAGSVVVILLGVYYSALIFLLGAEFTRVYADERGSRCGGGTGQPGGRRGKQSPIETPVTTAGGSQSRGAAAAGLERAGGASPAGEQSEHGDKMQLTETDYLSSEAESAKAEIQRTYSELKANMKGAASPGAWTREYPWAAVGIATAAGLAIGAMLLKARRRPEPQSWRDRLRVALEGDTGSRLRPQPEENQRRGLLSAALAGGGAILAAALKKTLQTALTTAVSSTAAGSVAKRQTERQPREEPAK